MKHKIALLADVHGNATALKAVIEDSMKESVTEYWFLGDLIMPGPGSNDLFEMLESINVDTYVQGNWEDSFLDVLNKNIDIDNATDIYVSRLVQYQCENLDENYIKQIKNLPLQITKQVNDLSISISHNLQNKNYGGDLWPTNNQEQFDRLFDREYDIAIYAHTHHQLLRYSSNDQLIINPGTVGQPFYKWNKLNSDLRAQYAILEIDEAGITDVRFKKVFYDVEKEYKNATNKNLPYIDLYRELLETGKTHTHDIELLQEINDKNNYKDEVIKFIEKV
ncbi:MULTISPECIES: metallophosphoesterase family protein [Bacillus cereus group]|uniref:metallophosphoesterase family protein n=1 Tax=Bacillus cereus group TaxID=86661 RepID=UPI001BB30E8E|nr:MULTISPECIES: metallophosphoesterase family protein [Bacillus cereus group]MDD8002604.1 metallophosphoesterase family protein [Bacillus cereus]MDQ4480898.1 metallophosphoesterase family protein [Bacillus cereus]MEB9454985.1 metallophosphoesterase family protein [Bacillus anthracis]MEB9507814.1 metallophosphoesterase family protein [Bacillus anthracis]QUW24168.1 metallophosphoesterase family protein [Bacillus cereus]